MDISCRYCGEPWEIDTLHEEARERKALGLPGATFERARVDFGRLGCGGLYAFQGMSTPDTAHVRVRGADPRIGALTDMLGGDVDGLASMLEEIGL